MADITANVWAALSRFRWFGKHVDDADLDAAYKAVEGAVNGGLTALRAVASPRVVVVCMADDWEALYVEGQLQFEGHRVELRDLEAHLPDLRIDTIEVTEGQWGAWGFRAPETLEEL